MSEPLDSMSIAIVGMAGSFPGAADVEDFWRNLKDAVESITFFNGDDLDKTVMTPEERHHPSYVRAAGVIEGEELFDAAFFDFNPREAEITDPQQRLLLEAAWQALEDAGYDPDRFAGTIGTFAGVGMNMYFVNNVLAHPEVFRSTPPLQMMIGTDKDYVAPRMAYKMNLRGPAVCVQSACSTSLVAVHLACQSLQDLQCDLALAGGASLRVPQHAGYVYQEGGIFSPDGHCRAFDKSAAGTVSGSGVGVVALKRYEEALEDGDRILAVIRGSAINNDGNAKVGFTAPGVEGQVAVISEALAAADVEASSIGYVEAHGTATALGDPIEVAALTEAFAGDSRRGTRVGEACALGSVKSNVGHLDTAAGVTGLIKTVQALRHRQIPPSLHFEEPHPDIDFAATPFYVNAELVDWPRDGVARRAGVSSFGIGGTNAHVVVEEAPEPEPSGASRPWQLLVLSARTASALDAATDNLARHLEKGPDAGFADAAYTAQVGRKRFEHRRALVCHDRDDAVAALRRRDPERLLAAASEARERPVAFLFPGQGAQYVDMARGLYDAEPTFRHEVDAAAEILEPHLGLDLRQLLYPPAKEREEAARRLGETALTQPALFVVEHALARLLREWGVEPAAMLGHSVGEYVAATLAGVLTPRDALALVAARGRLMQSLPAGDMLAVALAEAELAPRLGGELSLAAANAPALQVVSGPTAAVAAFEAELAREGVEVRRLHTSHAFHSAMMEPILDEFAAELAKVTLEEPRIPIVSNLTGTWLTAGEATDPDYWVRHLRRAVRFGDGLATLAEEPARLLLEVGPGRTLATLARRHEERPPEQLVLGSVRHADADADDVAFLLRTLGRSWLAGVEIDWHGFSRHERRRRVALPTYPFERRRYWLEPRDLAGRLAVAPHAGTEAPDGADGADGADASTPDGHQRPGLANAYVAPRGAAEEKLAAIWRESLGLAEVGVYDDFFELDGHSLLATQICDRARRAFQVDVPLGELYEKPTIAAMTAVLEGARENRGEAVAPGTELPTVVPDPRRRCEPFPLTDVQQAYWIGRQPTFELGGVATHVYTEIVARGVDLETATRAWRRLVERHDMLRAIVLPDGRQQVLAKVPPYEIELLDLRDRPPEEAETALAELRRRMSQQVLPADQWPLFEVRASLPDDEHCRLHLSFDLLIGDAWSWEILSREFQLLYQRPELELEPFELSFRDYVLTVAELESSAAFERDLGYWRRRLPDFPAAPELPFAVHPGNLGKPRFVRLATTLDRELWARIKERATGAALTPSGILLAAFAEVLAAWSKTPRFAVNLTLFNRLPLHPEVDALVGDFTSLTLLEVDEARDEPFLERARCLQRQLWDDLDHRLVSAVRVLRELGRLHGSPARALMGVVFTSTLNMRRPEEEGVDGGGATPHEGGDHNISQTPQVWLDHQVGERGGTLFYNWDLVEDLFPDGLPREMFDAYTRLLHRLADDEAAWQERLPLTLPPAQLVARAAADATAALPEKPAEGELLHLPFLAQAWERPEAPAVICDERTLTYGELARRAYALAVVLREHGARPNQLVAVVMAKGWEQVVAVLAVLEAGAAYLPVDPSLPVERRLYLLANGEVEIALTQSRLSDTLAWPEDVELVAVDQVEPSPEPLFLKPVQGPDDLAYVIFTSGSTGEPKGVMIDHRAAANTIADVNQRFGVGAGDRVLAVSALHFDLSVYDVFGLLAAGGALVLPPGGGDRDPALWSRQMQAHGVTLWSSVPALMELVVDDADGRAESLPEALRLVMLSGDWIPVSLPGRIRDLRPAAEVVSLGGATEASIWSILHPIGDVDPEQPSIPYGQPMRNQSFQVLDHRLDPRPVWVPGELWIGGAGLAQGYWRDPEKTAARFPTHPRTGERLYRTGDLGRYLPDGDIQLLGRVDFQVKIRGYRIELGEIEAALDHHAGVRESVVLALSGLGPSREMRLAACFIAVAGEPPAEGELRAHLRAKLPEYMVPAFYTAVENWPLTPNGKVDRAALGRAASGRAASGRAASGRAASGASEHGEDGSPRQLAPPESETEEVLVEICRTLLGVDELGIDDDFFELGGDSLMATRLIFQIRKEFDIELPVRSFFDEPSVRQLAGIVEEKVLKLSPEERSMVEKRLRGKGRKDERAVQAAASAAAGEDLAAVLEQPPEPLVDAALWHQLVTVGHREARARWSAEDLAHEAAGEGERDRKAVAYISLALHRIGVFRQAGERYTIEELWQRARVLPDYHRAMRRWMKSLVDEGLVVRDGEHFVSTVALPPESLDVNLSDHERDLYSENLPAVLRGDKHPLEYFIPDGSSEKVEENYARSPTFRYCNGVSSRLLRTQVGAMPVGRKLRILEVGAGTGGTTVSLLPELPDKRAIYVYTDVSKFFTDLGREKFARYSFLRYAEMDVENDPTQQGLPAHAFDWIVAAHVLHATRDLRRTLGHVRRLLAPGGVLLLLEETKFLRKFNFSMGFLPGFDHFEDEDLRQLHPLLDSEQWCRLLGEEGFGDAVSFTDPQALPQKLGVDVLLARLGEEQSRAAGRALLTRHSTGIPRRPDPETAPLSFAQERLWRFAERHPGSCLHNVRHAVRLAGELEVSVLERVLSEVVRRHEALRTRFEEDNGRPVARLDVAGSDVTGSDVTGSDVTLPVVDLALLAEDRRQDEAARLIVAAAERPFDLARGPLLRCVLLRLEPRRHVLSLLLHHIVIDGWSLQILDQELAALYEAFRAGRASPLPELAVRYGDFAGWQRRRTAAGELDRQLEWWRRHLAGAPETWRLPFGRARPAARRCRAAGHDAVLGRELSEALSTLARKERATLFMVVLAAFSALIHRSTGQDDVVVGTPAAGRSHEALDGVVGLLLNLLPLRVDLSGDPTFRELLGRVREATLETYSHQELPFEHLLEKLGFTDDPRRPPLVQVVFNLPTRGTGEGEPLRAGQLGIEPFLTRDAGSEHDLTFYAIDAHDGLRIHFGYDAELFEPSQMAAWSDSLRCLLEEIVRDGDKRLSEY